MLNEKWRQRLRKGGRILLCVLVVAYLLAVLDDLNSIQSDLSSVQTDVSDIQSDLSSIQSDVNSIASSRWDHSSAAYRAPSMCWWRAASCRASAEP